MTAHVCEPVSVAKPGKARTCTGAGADTKRGRPSAPIRYAPSRDTARGPTSVFLGAEEKLFIAPDGAWISHSAHLPMRIEPAADGATTLRASIGQRPALRWVKAAGAAPTDIAGSYRCVVLDIRHDIAVQDGVLALRPGGGPVPEAWPLVATAPDCLAASAGFVGPWRLRPALRIQHDAAGRVRGFTLSSNRSRGWWFERL